MSEGYKLTAKQIKEIDEIAAERRAHENLYNQAINYHTNRLIEIERLEHEWWKEMAEIHGFDLRQKHEVNKQGAFVVIRKLEQENE